jgi:hypothetical protein
VKVSKSFELDPFAEQTEQLVYKSSTWTVKVKLGRAWDPPAETAAPDTNRYVLAWDDAAMVADPKDTKKPPIVERPLPSGRTDALTQASPVRVVDTYGDTPTDPSVEAKITHLEIETVPSPGPAHCQAGGPPIEPFPVQHYVPLKDIVSRVTTHEVAAKLPDGTGYRVAAGVPVVAEGDKWRVQTGGLSFLIDATEDDLAFYYRPSPHFLGTPSGPQRVKPGVVGRTALGDVTWAGPEPLVIAGMRGAGKPIATLQVPCAEVRIAPDVTTFVNAGAPAPAN